MPHPLVQEMLAGKRIALARMISKVESRDSDLRDLVRDLYPLTGKAQVLGITGPPGSGKSTLVDQLVAQYRARGKRVGIVAIDPSSPFSGGAILGDRIRMQRHHADEGVYIRSLGTRGKQGGLSHATKEVTLVLDAAGFDLIIVETAGVGQTELDILKLAHTVLVVLVPESGDSIQVMKAGLMEIADLFVVNKTDRPEADRMVKELITMVSMGSEETAWKIPVHKTQAVNGTGVTEVVNTVAQHWSYLLDSKVKISKDSRFLEEEIKDILTERLQRSVDDILESDAGRNLLEKAVKRELDPYQVADQITKKISN